MERFATTHLETDIARKSTKCTKDKKDKFMTTLGDLIIIIYYYYYYYSYESFSQLR